MNRKEAIEYISKNKQGKKSVLIENIGEHLFLNFGLLGYIERGLSDNGEDMYKTTALGLEQQQLYEAPSEEEATWGISYSKTTMSI